MPLNPNAVELKNYDLGGTAIKAFAEGQAQAKSSALAAKVAKRGKTPISDIYAQQGMGEQSLKAAELEAKTAKNQASVQGSGLDNMRKKFEIAGKANQELIGRPDLSKPVVAQTIEAYHKSGMIDDTMYQQYMDRLPALPDDPEQLREHLKSQVMGLMDAQKQMGFLTPDANALLSDKRAARGQMLTARGQDIGARQFDKTLGLNERKFDEDVGQNEFERVNKAAQYNLSARELGLKENAKTTDKTANNQGAIDSIDTAMESLNSIINHPGLQSVVGAPNPLVGSFGSAGALPGTDAAGFNARLETFKAQTFVPMVAQLKGMGALSDAEGKKLSAAVGALDPKMPESEFIASAKNILQELQLKKERALGYNGPRPQHGASGNWDGMAEKHGLSPEQHAAILKAMGGQ